jgi:hypothetical protein
MTNQEFEKIQCLGSSFSPTFKDKMVARNTRLLRYTKME